MNARRLKTSANTITRTRSHHMMSVHCTHEVRNTQHGMHHGMTPPVAYLSTRHAARYNRQRRSGLRIYVCSAAGINQVTSTRATATLTAQQAVVRGIHPQEHTMSPHPIVYKEELSHLLRFQAPAVAAVRTVHKMGAALALVQHREVLFAVQNCPKNRTKHGHARLWQDPDQIGRNFKVANRRSVMQDNADKGENSAKSTQRTMRKDVRVLSATSHPHIICMG